MHAELQSACAHAGAVGITEVRKIGESQTEDNGNVFTNSHSLADTDADADSHTRC